jgi:hypothetical protein
MTTKAQAILRDTLFILFFGLYTGMAFSLINHLVLLLVQPFLLVPLMFIRSGGYTFKMGKRAKVIILSSVILIIAILEFEAYFMGVKSADSSQWPFALKLSFGLFFLICMVVVLYKLLQDMKIPEEDGR